MPPPVIVSHIMRTALLLALGAQGGCAGAWMTQHLPTTVQDIDGQRVDVPQRDLASDGSGLLRNGLTPQPQEFN
jgi:hypothetical protein